MQTPKLVVVPYTGGPCGGKTTALALTRERIEGFGIPVISVPEIARDFLANGITPDRFPSVKDFQTHLLRHQIEREERWRQAALMMNAPVVLMLCDRGARDAAAYIAPDVWDQILRELNLNEFTLGECRYDMVVHLRSAAVGAEAFYVSDRIRRETVEEARVLDERTLQAWRGYPHLVVVDNSTDFAGKVRRAVAAVCHALGVPEPRENERKYEMRPVDVETLPIPCTTFHILQDYLVPHEESEERRVRKWSRGDAAIYYETVKRRVPGMSRRVRVQLERIIEQREYEELLSERFPGRQTIEKTRTIFIWNNLCYELDRFIRPHPGLCLLEAELVDPDQPVLIPPFLQMLREVTEDPNFSNAALAMV